MASLADVTNSGEMSYLLTKQDTWCKTARKLSALVTVTQYCTFCTSQVPPLVSQAAHATFKQTAHSVCLVFQLWTVQNILRVQARPLRLVSVRVRKTFHKVTFRIHVRLKYVADHTQNITMPNFSKCFHQIEIPNIFILSKLLVTISQKI